MVLGYILIGIGVLFLGYGIYLLITKKYGVAKEKEYTKESLLKAIKVEAISDIVVSVGILFAGLGYNGSILPVIFYYLGFGIAIVGLIADSIIENKILVKLEK